MEKLLELLNTYEKFKHDSNFIKNEKEIAQSLILPFFRDILNWNIENPNEFFCEVTIAGKRVDYITIINGISQFVIEAKSIQHQLKDNIDFYKQTIQYAESKELKYAILTNFKEFIILRCDVQPKNNIWQTLEVGYIEINDFKNNSINILDYFKKEYWIDKTKKLNELDQKLNLNKKTSIDERLLNNLISWRKSCLKWLKNYLPEIFENNDKEYIEEEVQRFLNRILFICHCEDKELEDKFLNPLLHEYNHSLKLSHQIITKGISKIFNHYQKRYNSDLFEIELCDKFNYYDNIIIEILKDLKNPDKELPFDFSLIPFDILGRAYENFIGRLLRKKEGIYYTPEHIVKFITFNTLNEQLEGKSYNELLNFKVIDLACGSGSFLINAFDIFVRHAIKSLKKEILSYEEKINIFKNCIFGIDKDERACNIAKLNISLKLAEKGRALPRLNNIFCYDSLIDDEKIADKKAINYKKFINQFDFIIGNPPYGDYFNSREKQYIQKQYKITFSGHIDIYIPFFELCEKFLKPNGILGYITSHTYLDYPQYSSLRKFLLNKFKIKILIKTYDVFKDPIVDNAIIICQKNDPNVISKSNYFYGGNIKDHYNLNSKLIKMEYSALSENKFSLISPEFNIIKRQYLNTIPLNNMVNIHQGITTGGDKIYCLKYDKLKELKLEKLSFIKKCLFGENIDFYKVLYDDYYILYLNKNNPINLNHYQELKSYLNIYQEKLSKKREVAQGKQEWFYLHWARNESDFLKNKIIIRQTASKFIGTVDIDNYYVLDSIHTLTISEKFKIKEYNDVETLKIILTIINSTFFYNYYTQTLNEEGKVYPQIKKEVIEKFPVPFIEKNKYFDKLLSTYDQISTIRKLNINNFKDIGYYKNKLEESQSNIDNIIFSLYKISNIEQMKLKSNHIKWFQ
ncbi:MAG: N-6 DNA methylase [Candidatus Nanoarchaeia archaeon]|nr:N-6 DNA methylase [Candidatus Nanoarchaeia archaeon]